MSLRRVGAVAARVCATSAVHSSRAARRRQEVTALHRHAGVEPHWRPEVLGDDLRDWSA